MTAAALGLPLTFPARASGPGRPRHGRSHSASARICGDPAGHHRRRGRARLRRCGLGRAGPVVRKSGRPPAAGRDRRCRPLCPRQRRARPRGAQPRQLGLFPRPRHPDAAGGAVQRSVLAPARRGSRLPRGLDHHRPAGRAPLLALQPRPDAQPGAADLHPGPGGPWTGSRTSRPARCWTP